MPFRMPPLLHNAEGDVRRVGVEFEFAGPAPAEVARLVQELFGGEIVEENEFSYEVTGSGFGDFSVLLDARLLKEKSYERFLAKAGIELTPEASRRLAETLLKSAGYLVPLEVVTPPIPLDRLEELEELRRRLQQNQARGTRSALRYAFGLHFNPEVPSLERPRILAYLRSFLVLYPWLRRRSQVDLARRIAPYIQEFPPDYTRLILAESYAADGLIPDFLAHNPTRNRPLDLLPLFVLLDRETVMAAEVEKELIKPRPALHYRLPNCLIDDPEWTLASEWNNWVEVERLGADPDRLGRLCRDYLELAADQDEEGWATELEKVL